MKLKKKLKVDFFLETPLDVYLLNPEGKAIWLGFFFQIEKGSAKKCNVHSYFIKKNHLPTMIV